FEPYWVSLKSIDAYWENNMSVKRGNLALSDGSVQMTTSKQLQEQIAAALNAGSTNVTISKPQGTLCSFKAVAPTARSRSGTMPLPLRHETRRSVPPPLPVR